jgi:serine/threonine protein kinase
MEPNPTSREGGASPHGDPLEQIARDLLDGKPIDWVAYHLTYPGLRARMNHLRSIEDLARIARRGPGTGDRIAPERWGRFTIVGSIGEGRSSIVYRAMDPAGAPVALKLFRTWGQDVPRPILMFLRDLERMSSLRHRNLVAIRGVGFEEGRAGMWADLVPGVTAEALLARQGPLPPPRILDMALSLCGGLSALHDAGIVHGAVDTAKLRVTPGDDGRIVLMDFGPALHVHEILARTREGRPTFCAPETLHGSVPGFASDVFSAGAVLYRLATGRSATEPGRPGTAIRSLRARRTQPLDGLLPGFPRDLAMAIHAALAPHPADRFAGARAFLDALPRAGAAGQAPFSGGGQAPG